MAIDFAKSLKGAEEGSPVHQGFVGWCYLYGQHVEIDYQKAFRWLSAAAEQRASRPFTHLGRMYAEGLGVPQDMAEAIRRFRAVEKVEPRAQLGLASSPKGRAFPQIQSKPCACTKQSRLAIISILFRQQPLSPAPSHPKRLKKQRPM